MIVPGDFKNFTSGSFFKLSWMVLFLNLFVYFGIVGLFKQWPSREISEKLNDDTFKQSVYEMYLQTLDPIEKKRSESVDSVYNKALKDEKFWNRIETFPFHGDKVQIDEVRQVMGEFYRTYKKSPQFLFGLGSFDSSPWTWLTYQFVHANLLHLFGNLIIIFLVISHLELTVSAAWIGAVYLLSGFVGGIFFLSIDTSGTMSVIGASASASGLMAFLVMLEGSKLMPWFYFFAPVRDGFGKIYLPVFFIFPIFLMSDFASLLWEANGVATNIAVSAHVGGSLTGLALGLGYLLFGRESASHRIFSHYDGLDELP